MEQNNGEKIKVLVYSEYWDEPIEVEMSEEAFADPKLRLVLASPQIKRKARLITLLPIDFNLLEKLANENKLKFERASDVPREDRESTALLADAVPEAKAEPVQDDSQQRIIYERDDEPARGKEGYPGKNDAEDWRHNYPMRNY